MEIQQLKDSALAVFVSSDDLRHENIDPAALTDSDTEKLLTSVFSRLGRQRGEHICLELFPGRDCLMMFVRSSPDKPVFFTFDSFDTLISSAEEWRGGAASTLWYIDGRYVLALWPWDRDFTGGALCEFGNPLSRPPEYERYLSEHGRTLASPDALGLLRSVFAANTL